ncbi:hypothetical protein DPV78_009831 [Talaromyces pinophilus]|nr:hypothetical protein DPV78_009831 [Talaromyces pinophilus]
MTLSKVDHFKTSQMGKKHRIGLSKEPPQAPASRAELETSRAEQDASMRESQGSREGVNASITGADVLARE